MRSTKRLVLLALPAALLVALIAFAFVSAQRALNRAADTTRNAAELPFTLISLDLTTPATPALEPVATPTTFTSGAFFQGDLYLAGPTGLSIYAPDGTLRRTLRTGLELPVSPVVALTTARLRASSEPQLLLATAGAGLLLLDPDTRTSNAPITLHQLLPATPDLRDLTALLPLPSGDLLLGTRHNGVLLFNGTTLTPLRFTLEGTNPARLEVTALAAADSASILIGTRNSGLFYLHGGTVAHADTTSGLPDNQIETLAATPTQAFVGTPQGIAQFNLAAADSGSLRPARILAPGLFTNALALNPAATELTAGTLDQGIQQIRLDVNPSPHPRLRNASLAFPTLPQTAQRIDHFLTAPNQPGSLYALADGTLLLRNSSSWSPALPPAATPVTLTDRNISALAFDPTGRLYVGFFDRGLDVIAPNPATPIRHFEDDHLFCINRLVLDPTRQTIAAATANGLVLFDAQATPRQVLTRRDGLISDHISDIVFTRTGTTLATPAGLTFLTSTGPESLYAFQGLVNNHVYALASSSSQPGGLLAGTLGGLSLLENQTIRRNFTVTNSGLEHNWITALAPLPDGSTLLGTYGAGLLRLTTDRDGTTRFTPIDLPAATPRDLVINPNAILATSSHVYAGTLDHGLLVYTAATARWSNVTHGLPSLNVTAFATRDSILYIGTDNGLVRIPEPRLP